MSRSTIAPVMKRKSEERAINMAELNSSEARAQFSLWRNALSPSRLRVN
jgi:hypothetical protein